MRWTLVEPQTLNQMGVPIFVKTGIKRLESDRGNDEDITRGDPPGQQLHPGRSGEDDETYCSKGQLVDDGMGTGNMEWVGDTDDDEDATDSDLSNCFMDDDEFDFEDLPSFYSPCTPTSYRHQLIASVFNEKRGYVAEWDMELELMRVIMENEPHEGGEYNEALNGGYSF